MKSNEKEKYIDKVSIIIPAYNCASTIEKCIESIIKQSYKNLEIIIVNDGSTDNTESIINKLSKQDNRIKVLYQKNSGVSVARNTGIDNSTGEYLMFVDSDDWIDKICVEEVVKAIKQQKVDVVRFNYTKEELCKSYKQKLYDLSNKVFRNAEVVSEKIISHLLYTNEAIPNYVMLLLINTKLIKNKMIRFNKDLYMLEDVYFYQELLHCANSIYFLNKSLYHYNNCNISATRDRKKAIKNIYGIFESGKKIKKLLDDKNTTYSLKKFNSWHLNLSITYLSKAISISNYINSKKIIKNLSSNKYFQELVNIFEKNDLTTYRKMVIFLINKRCYFIVYLMLKTRIYLKK